LLRRALLAIALLALALPAAAQGQAARPLKVAGGKIVDDRGRQVILHGVNVVYKRPPYYPAASGPATNTFTRTDLRQLRAWGFNSIRLGVIWAGLEPQPGVIDQGYLDHIGALVDLAAEQNFWVLLDMHQDLYSERFGGEGAPDWAVRDDGIPFSPVPGDFSLNYTAPAVGRSFDNFWADKDGIRTEFVRAFTTLAERFAGSDTVLGYDLFNEPVCELQAGPPCVIPPDPAAATQFLMPLYDQLVPALHAVDDTHPVFYEDAATVNQGFPFLIGAPGGPVWPFPNQALSHHVYCVPVIRPGVPCPLAERQATANAVASAAHNGVAPQQTEFGATDNLATLRRVTTDADRYGEGWMYWQYKTYDDPTTSSAQEPGGADAESVVAASGRAKTRKVDVLARAYPERIAGTGAHWSYDDRRHRFMLSYRPRGRAPTVVVLPKPAFPNGACTLGSGFTRSADPEPTRLRLHADRGARRVSFVAFPTHRSEACPKP
jgi:endoglycosylceramidase